MEENQIPPAMVRCSYERFSDNGAYVIGKMNYFKQRRFFSYRAFVFLENGLVMYIWLGSQLDPTFVQYVFGVQSASQIQAEKVKKSFFFDFSNFIFYL